MCCIHPQYKGKFKPKANCIDCWAQWFAVTEYKEPLNVKETNNLLYILLRAESDRKDHYDWD